MSDDLIKALQKEAREDAEIITRLRAENERLREALEPIVGVLINYTEDDYSDYEYAPALIGDLRAARAAIEGVTEPAKGESNGK